ncbi:MAG: hypothetical protein H6R26_3375 [Proteobacteria bacterium]|nr:hypothetical protein [Pseudomonadota bacterium]
MHKRSHFGLCILLLLAAVLVITGCQREESETPATTRAAQPSAAAVFQVVSLELGNTLGVDRRVITPATVFAPTDTIYASVGC